MKAPIFKSISTNKNNFDIKNFSGKYIVLYFYPKDDTPGCTIETNDFINYYLNLRRLIVKFLVFPKIVSTVTKNLKKNTVLSLIYYLMRTRKS